MNQFSVTSRRISVIQKGVLLTGAMGLLLPFVTPVAGGTLTATEPEPVLIATAQYGYLIPYAVLLSTAKNGKSGEQAYPFFQSGRVFRLLNQKGVVTGPVLRAGQLEMGEGESPTMLKTLPSPPESKNDTTLLALSVSFKQPTRSVTMIPPSPEDRMLIRDYLKHRGIPVKSPKLSATLVTDLDGDGTWERVVSADAGREDSKGRLINWYSVALLAAGNSKVYSLGSAVISCGSESDVMHVNVISVADLNGDGTRELAVNIGYYEGSNLALYSWNGSGINTLTGVKGEGTGPVNGLRWKTSELGSSKVNLPKKVTTAPPSQRTEAQAIRKVIRDKAGNYKLSKIDIRGDWALAVGAIPGNGDGADFLLRKRNGIWKILTYGTDLGEEGVEYEIPKSLRRGWGLE